MQVTWQIQLALLLEVPTEATLCLKPPITPPISGSMGHQLLPVLNSQDQTIDAMLPDGNCLFLSLSKALFAVSSGHLTLRKIVVNFIKSNSRLLGGLCNSSLEDHCKRMEKPGTFGTQAELQAASSLLQVPVYIFQKPNELRDWEWMVYNPQSKSQLDFSVCPGLAALQPPNNFNIEIFYHATHFDVITSTNPTALLPFPYLPRENTSEFIDLS
jgi:hypothetical protein